MLSRVASHEFIAALVTVKPDWKAGDAITDAEADAAAELLFAGKMSQAKQAAEAKDAELHAKIDGYLRTRYVSGPSAGKATDVAGVDAWHTNGLALHASMLANDKAKAFAVVDVILAGAATAATGNPMMAAAALGPIVEGFKAFSSSGDLSVFEGLAA